MRERERDHKQGGGVDREAGSPLNKEPDVRQDSIPGPWDHDLSRRQMLNRLSHPGAPYGIVESLCYTPETNNTLYIN